MDNDQLRLNATLRSFNTQLSEKCAMIADLHGVIAILQQQITDTEAKLKTANESLNKAQKEIDALKAVRRAADELDSNANYGGDNATSSDH